MAVPFSTSFAGPGNVYIPSFDSKASANLVISYARDPKKFAVNKLAQRSPVKTLAGYFLTLRPEALAKVIANPNELVWVDGQPRPRSVHNEQDFRATIYQCMRRVLTDELGDQTKDQAAWDIETTIKQTLAHKMMTFRAVDFYDTALTTANHLSTHVKTATQWGGGFWDAGTTADPIVKRGLLSAADQIRKDSMSAIDYKDLTVVISPTAAIALATSQEIHDYLAQNVLSLAQIRGDDDNQNGAWGLPTGKLYGMNLVIDPTLKTTSARLVNPGTTTDIMDDNTALILATPGSLGSNIGQVESAFSSVHMFVYNGEEMVVESYYDQNGWNKRTLYSIFETYQHKIVAPETCALVTNLFS